MSERVVAMRDRERCQSCGHVVDFAKGTAPAHMTNRRSGITHEANVHGWNDWEYGWQYDNSTTFCSGHSDSDIDRWDDSGATNRVTCKRCARRRPSAALAEPPQEGP